MGEYVLEGATVDTMRLTTSALEVHAKLSQAASIKRAVDVLEKFGPTLDLVNGVATAIMAQLTEEAMQKAKDKALRDLIMRRKDGTDAS